MNLRSVLMKDSRDDGFSGYGRPLPTEDDLPCDDGVPMETTRHRDQMHLLIESLKTYWKDSRRYYVSGNMFLHYEPFSRKKFKGPDFFLVLDVDSRERKSWVVWQEGMRFPDVIIELLSDSTRKKDKTEKKVLYEKTFGTSEYYIYDPFRFEFEGYRLTRKGYKTILPGKDKKIYSPAAGLYLAIKDEWLRWMTKDGYVLPSPIELADEATRRAGEVSLLAEKATRLADEAARRAEQAALFAEKATLFAEKEKQRADQEKQRAEKEMQRAETERYRAETEKLLADAEKSRAEKAIQCADEAIRLAEAEKNRAENAEKQIVLEREKAERLAAKLKELGISPD